MSVVKVTQEDEHLMQEFYLSEYYNPKAARPADNVAAAIAFVRQSATAELCEGLEKAATWFEEYAGAHDRKMREAVDSYEKARRADKAIRNTDRAKELRALLSKHSPDAPGQHAGTRATESGDGDL